MLKQKLDMIVLFLLPLAYGLHVLLDARPGTSDISLQALINQIFRNICSTFKRVTHLNIYEMAHVPRNCLTKSRKSGALKKVVLMMRLVSEQ